MLAPTWATVMRRTSHYGKRTRRQMPLAPERCVRSIRINDAQSIVVAFAHSERNAKVLHPAGLISRACIHFPRPALPNGRLFAADWKNADTVINKPQSSLAHAASPQSVAGRPCNANFSVKTYIPSWKQCGTRLLK